MSANGLQQTDAALSRMGVKLDPLHEQEIRTRIESVRLGDKVIFNDRSVPIEVVDVDEQRDGKVIHFEGNRGAKYRLEYDRVSGMIDFAKTESRYRSLTVDNFSIENRDPRPFADVPMDEAEQLLACVDSAMAYVAVSSYLETFVTEEGGVTGDIHLYRDLSVLAHHLDISNGDEYTLSGPEVELVTAAFDHASESFDFNAEEQKAFAEGQIHFENCLEDSPYTPVYDVTRD